MVSVAEFRDLEKGVHISRTQNFVRILAEELQSHQRFRDFLNKNTITLIYKASPLHDIDKVAIPDNILLKLGKLNKEEFEVMKIHAIKGSEAISRSQKKLASNSFLKFAMEIAISHHEKWDGMGYPYGLKREDIPVSGRLMAIVDVYDALVRRRVYNEAFTHQKAVDIIFEGKGTYFDPDVVEAFIAREKDFEKISLEMADRSS